jgi:hypothetical protein
MNGSQAEMQSIAHNLELYALPIIVVIGLVGNILTLLVMRTN